MYADVYADVVPDTDGTLNTLLKGDSGDIKLDGDITLTRDITVSGTHTLDLNGHKLSLDGKTLTVGSGATLTIMDSTAAQEPVPVSSSISVENAGQRASYTDGTLTYYVTKSNVDTTKGVGRTTETLEKYTVSTGIIDCGGNGSIQVSGGTLNLEGGYITGAKNSAAVHATSGIINLSGTVIAGNHQGIDLRQSTINMTGGVISGNGEATLGGNEATDGVKGGGGIYATGSTLHLSGGYLTNNRAQKGGGLYVHQEYGGGIAELSGSLQITGNCAEKDGGGGVMLDRCECQIEGGFISQNTAATAEGGGIRIDYDASCIVRAGYITNNRTNTQEHWGGGGIFCANGSRLLVQGALITHNEAGGFGGGVAGCSTGRLMVVAAAGAAIYDNKDHPDGKEPNLSGNASTQDADHMFWEKDEVFRENGCDDYFCALSSVIDGSMLGGGSANWSGSADGVAYENVGRGQTLTAGRVMGLTAHPSEAGQQNAANRAQVYITGNYSYTHGGGILNNGYTVIGETKEFEIPKGVILTMQKDVLTDTGMQKPAKDAYQFEVTDANGKVIRTVTNDGDGAIQFSFDYGKDDFAGVPERGTRDFTYYVREIMPKDPDPQMTYDPSVYRVVVTVTWNSEEEISFQQGSSSIKKCIYRPTEVKVYKGSSEKPLEAMRLDYNETKTQTVDLTQTAKFVNSSKKDGVTSVTVRKVWSDGNEKHSDASVTVQLLQNGKEYEDPVTLNNSISWSHKWENLPLSAENGENYTYTVKESNAPAGYVASYETDSDFMEGGYFVPATKLEAGGKYIIVSPDGNYALQTTWANRDIPFNANDKADISTAKRGDGQLEIGGTSYNEWYTAKDIINSGASVYEAQPSQYGYWSLVCKVQDPDTHQTVNSWLALGGDGGVHLKGTIALSWNSPFWITGDRLRGGINNKDYSGGTWYEIQYINGVFGNIQNKESGNAAKVYRWVGDYDASSTITITNTPANEVPYTLELTKTNEDGNRSLGGAAFQLIVMEEGAIKTNGDGTPVTLKFDSNGVGSYSVTDAPAVLDAITTDQGGKLVVTGIPAGTYTLREVTPPPGYALAEDQVLTFDEETAANHKLNVTVKDELPVLPKTGGVGTGAYVVAGVALIAIAGGAAVWYAAKRRKNGGDADA